MTTQTEFQATAKRGAVDGSNYRFTTGLQAANHPLGTTGHNGHFGGVINFHEHGDVCTGKKIFAGGGNHQADHRVIGDRFFDRFGKRGHRRLAENVGTRVHHVPGKGSDTVLVNVVINHGSAP